MVLLALNVFLIHVAIYRTKPYFNQVDAKTRKVEPWMKFSPSHGCRTFSMGILRKALEESKMMRADV